MGGKRRKVEDKAAVKADNHESKGRREWSGAHGDIRRD
jgi:hypothetical protein